MASIRAFFECWAELIEEHQEWTKGKTEEQMSNIQMRWFREVENVSDEDLHAATTVCLRTVKWFPKLPEFLDAIAAVQAGEPGRETALEAWGIVERAIHLGTGADTIFSNPHIARLVRGMGGLRQIEQGENPTADRARFIDSYEHLAAGETKQARATGETIRRQPWTIAVSEHSGHATMLAAIGFECRDGLFYAPEQAPLSLPEPRQERLPAPNYENIDRIHTMIADAFNGKLLGNGKQ